MIRKNIILIIFIAFLIPAIPCLGSDSKLLTPEVDILKWILPIIIFSLIIIMVVLFWNRKLKKEVLKRQKIEINLRKSEEKYRSIFENAVEGFFQSTPEGRFISVNPSFAKMIGYASPEELISNISDIANQYYANNEDRHRWEQLLRKDGIVEHFEFKALCKDGSHIWVSNSTRVIHDQDGKIIRYEGNVTDITERRKTEDTLQKSEEKFRTAFRTSPNAITLTNVEDGLYIDINDGFTKMLGYT
ncbi:MAG: PAS domain S-box protein, partial [Desulfobacteraceae bacterium]|nr:PAS domain S-box protein [Desulfobacteraceae bacterium]